MLLLVLLIPHAPVARRRWHVVLVIGLHRSCTWRGSVRSGIVCTAVPVVALRGGRHGMMLLLLLLLLLLIRHRRDACALAVIVGRIIWAAVGRCTAVARVPVPTHGRRALGRASRERAGYSWMPFRRRMLWVHRLHGSSC